MTPEQIRELLYDGNKCKVYTNEWLTLVNTPKRIIQATINQKHYLHVRIATRVNLVDHETNEKTFSHYEWQEYRECKGNWKKCGSYGWYNSIEEMSQEVA